MKICKIKNISHNQFYNIINKTLPKSVLVNFQKKYITKYFFRYIIDNNNFISICAIIKNKCVGLLIVNLNKKKFSFKFLIITFYFALKAFFKNKRKILHKLFHIKFSQRKIFHSRDVINYNYAEILYIGVDKNFRRKKIGQKLLIFFEEKIKKKIKKIIVSSENSYEAVKFYKHNNYKIIGNESRFNKKNILLVKKL